MKKSQYTGILRRRTQDEPDEAAIYEALFGFYKIEELFTAAGWEKLAKALAADHVPALSQAQPRKGAARTSRKQAKTGHVEAFGYVKLGQKGNEPIRDENHPGLQVRLEKRRKAPLEM